MNRLTAAGDAAASPARGERQPEGVLRSSVEHGASGRVKMLSIKQTNHRAQIFFVVGIAAVFAALLAACGSTESTPTPAPPTAAGETGGSSDPFQAE